MFSIAVFIAVVLTPVALVHLYWAFGGLWPASSPGELVKTVIGDPGLKAMPPMAVTLVVAVLIFAAGLMPLLYLAGIPAALPGWAGRYALWLLAAVFLGRGAVTYLWAAKAAALSEPFQTLNFWYFSPLCLLLGIGFAILAAFSTIAVG